MQGGIRRIGAFFSGSFLQFEQLGETGLLLSWFLCELASLTLFQVVLKKIVRLVHCVDGGRLFALVCSWIVGLFLTSKAFSSKFRISMFQNCFAHNSATKYCLEAFLYSERTAGYSLLPKHALLKKSHPQQFKIKKC